jgi:hypothetical protein
MKNLLMVIFLGVVLSIAANNAIACSCLAPSPDTPLRKLVAEAKADAVAVFVGKVVSVEPADSAAFAGTGAVRVKLEVARSWKGRAFQYIEVFTATKSGMCGVAFEVGKEYIVYANKGEGDSSAVYICSRTQTITGMSKDEKHLGKRQRITAPNKQ